MSFLLCILQGTPWWVWVVLGYVLFVGISSLRERKIELQKLFIMPILLNFWVFYLLFNSPFPYCFGLLYLVCISFGLAIGFKFAHTEKAKISDRGIVTIPGSRVSLVLLLSVFFVKYVFGYLLAVNPTMATEYWYVQYAVLFSVTGFFMGKLYYYVKQYRLHN